jgi:outer membrane lipoprotein-sorting protein
MKFLIVSLSLLFLVSNNFSVAQSDAKSQKILDEMSKEIKSLKSFKMEFSMKVKNSATGEDSEQKGTGYVQGDKYNAVLGDNEIMSNGIKVWTVVKEEKVVYQSDADEEDEESINPKKLMTIWEDGFKNKYVKEDKVNGKEAHVINLYPTNPGEVQYHTITIYIAKTGNEVLKAVMKTKDGSVITYTINKFEKNIEIPKSKFVFDQRKYPGFQLIRD